MHTAKLVTVSKHRVNGVLQYGVSEVTAQEAKRMQPLPARHWEPTNGEEPHHQEIDRLLEQGHVVLSIVG